MVAGKGGTMSEEVTCADKVTPDQLARFIHVALVTAVLCLSFFTIRLCFSIGIFERLYADMLGDKPLPHLTRWILNGRMVFLGFTLLVAGTAIGTLFSRRRLASLYLNVGLAFLLTVELLVLQTGLRSPLIRIFWSLTGFQ